MSCRILFGQAAIGDDPAVLIRVRHSRINLAVWKRAVAPNAAEYLSHIDLSALGSKKGDYPDGSYRSLWLHSAPTILPHAEFTAHEPAYKKMLHKKLDDVGFPDRPERAALVQEITKLSQAFAKAMDPNAGLMGFSLLVFNPVANNVGWHTDKGRTRGFVTLKGDVGTLWRPQESLPETKDKGAIHHNNGDYHFGPVTSESQRFMQLLDVGDLGVFRCGHPDRALVHATPPPPFSTQHRLVMVMGQG